MNRALGLILIAVIFCAMLVLANMMRGVLTTVERVTAAREAPSDISHGSHR